MTFNNFFIEGLKNYRNLSIDWWNTFRNLFSLHSKAGYFQKPLYGRAEVKYSGMSIRKV